MTSSPPKRRGVKSCLTAALDYARRGWPLIPLHAATADGCSCARDECSSVGKHPRTEHGLKDATTDEGVIGRWWDKWPEANVGIVTGAVSGLVVLDVDPRHGGDESLRVLGESCDGRRKGGKDVFSRGVSTLSLVRPGRRVRQGRPLRRLSLRAFMRSVRPGVAPDGQRGTASLGSLRPCDTDCHP